VTPDVYLARSAAIHKRVEILRDQIDALSLPSPIVRTPALDNLIRRHQKVIDELVALDKEYFEDAQRTQGLEAPLKKP
jgi:hypothetical protein